MFSDDTVLLDSFTRFHCAAFTGWKTSTFSKASVQDTQPFILSEIVRPNSRLSCRSSVTLCKSAQFSFRHSELRGATIQTDNNFWKYPYDRLVNVLQAGKMDGYLPGKLALVH